MSFVPSGGVLGCAATNGTITARNAAGDLTWTASGMLRLIGGREHAKVQHGKCNEF